MIVFQYGSNCLDAEMNGDERLCSDAKFIGVARADDFELAFDVQSRKRRCAAVDIVKRKGAVVWGVLYDVPDDLVDRERAKAIGRVSLDSIEGEGQNYERRKIKVCCPNGELVEAMTYTVREPKNGLRTSAAYVRCIIAGLRERGIEEGYIVRVKEIASKNNPEITTDVAAL